MGGCLIGCGVLALLLLLGGGGAAVWGFYWMKGKAGEIADDARANLEKWEKELKEAEEKNRANQDKGGNPFKDVLKDGPKDGPPKDGLAKDGPPKDGAVPPPGAPWETLNWGPPANFSAEFPGTPNKVAQDDGPNGSRGTASHFDALGTTFGVRWSDHAKDVTFNTPPKLIDHVMQLSGRHAKTRKEITLGAHPGVEFVADKNGVGRPRNITERACGVGTRIYEIYVDAPAGVKVPPEAVARFLNSFRYTGTVVTTPKTPTDPPAPAGGKLAKLTLDDARGWNGNYNPGTDEWHFTKPTAEGIRKFLNSVRVKASPDTWTLAEYQAKVATPGFVGPSTLNVTVMSADMLPDGFVIRFRTNRKTPSKTKKDFEGTGVLLVRDVGGVRLVASAMSLANEAVRDDAVAAFRNARLGP